MIQMDSIKRGVGLLCMMAILLGGHLGCQKHTDEQAEQVADKARQEAKEDGKFAYLPGHCAYVFDNAACQGRVERAWSAVATDHANPDFLRAYVDAYVAWMHVLASYVDTDPGGQYGTSHILRKGWRNDFVQMVQMGGYGPVDEMKDSDNLADRESSVGTHRVVTEPGYQIPTCVGRVENGWKVNIHVAPAKGVSVAECIKRLDEIREMSLPIQKRISDGDRPSSEEMDAYTSKGAALWKGSMRSTAAECPALQAYRASLAQKELKKRGL